MTTAYLTLFLRIVLNGEVSCFTVDVGMHLDMQVVAASQGLHVTSMALGHLLGFNEQTPLLQLMTGLRSIPCLASLVLLFADWSGEEHVSSRELMNTFNEHRRAGWSAITSWDALHEPVNA